MNTKVTNNNLDSDEGSSGTLDSNAVFGSERMIGFDIIRILSCKRSNKPISQQMMAPVI